MEYVFGTKGDLEILRTKGSIHSDLSGFQQFVQVYPDQTVTDNFRISRHLHSDQDAEGNCYDWYEIDHHYRVADKSASLAKRIAVGIAGVEDAMCEMDSLTDERLVALEDALCEIDKSIHS